MFHVKHFAFTRNMSPSMQPAYLARAKMKTSRNVSRETFLDETNEPFETTTHGPKDKEDLIICPIVSRETFFDNKNKTPMTYRCFVVEPERIRTTDLCNANAALYQMSYRLTTRLPNELCLGWRCLPGAVRPLAARFVGGYSAWGCV